MMTQRRERTVYSLRPRSTRPAWRTCCQTLTTSSRSVPSTVLAWDRLENTARCSPRDHVRGGEAPSHCDVITRLNDSILIVVFFHSQHLQILPGCGATSPGLDSGCTCGGTISSTTGLEIFPSRCTTRWVWNALKCCVCVQCCTPLLN